MTAGIVYGGTRQAALSRIRAEIWQLYSNMEVDPHLLRSGPELSAKFRLHNDVILEDYGRVKHFEIQTVALALDLHTWSAIVNTKRANFDCVESLGGWPKPESISIISSRPSNRAAPR